jgi:Phage late-transcription coactivator
MIEEKQFLTKQKFARLIEDVVHKRNLSYMDAVIDVCQSNDVELEDVRKFITPIIKDKIAAEAMRLNFLPRQNTLPID